MAAVGIATAVLAGVSGAWGYAPLCGWDAAALLFIAWVWLTIRAMGPSQTAQHATRQDPGRAVSDVIVLVAAGASLMAVGYVLIRAGSAKGSAQEWLAGLAIASVALSWFAVHTLFTLRYARAYYTGKDGGVDFKQNISPRYVDFAYLAFTIGMTFQVSDTDLRSSTMRAIALRHALLSYLFGAVILASMINLLAGLGTGNGG